jgi:hypothetical protein
MINPRKRRRAEISAYADEPDDEAMTQSKTTRRQLDIDAQIMYLSQGKHFKVSKPPRKNASTRNSLLQAPQPYPIIIRRVHKSIDEQRRVIWLRFGSLDAMEKQWHSAT